MPDLNDLAAFFADWLDLEAPGHPGVARTAETLAGDSLTIESYKKFQSKAWKWFLSMNPGLSGAVDRPASFDDWSDWQQFDWRAREVIANLAGLDPNVIAETAAVLADLKNGFATWLPSHYAVFQSGGSATNTCNIFVGEALFQAGRIMMKNGKYYAAAEIYSAQDEFRIVDEEVAAPGDLVAWADGHVEVVTKVNDDGTYCSNGAGRTAAVTFGVEKCGGPDDAQRYVDYGYIRFVRVD